MTFDNREIFPITAEMNDQAHLTLGGIDVLDLMAEYGSPLYVFDEATLRGMCREFVGEFTAEYAKTKVLYASKAFVNPAIAKLVTEEGLGIDVVSGGEVAVDYALDEGVGRFVIDSFHELDLLNAKAKARGMTQEVMLRLSPSVDPHTHVMTTTGILDSKFGFSIETGDAATAIRETLAASNLDLVGIHFHLGSPIFELEPYSIAVDAILTYLAPFKDEGLNLREFSPGGGYAIGYQRDQLPPSVGSYAEVITRAMKTRCADLGFGEPTLVVEPGRSIVGRAGVALYTVGGIKDIPTVRKYVSLDGGMGDNIRPALYGSAYEAVVANRMDEGPAEVVTLAGKYCESGDILVKDIKLPRVESGDIIAIPSSGAYAPSMASVYNLNPRPAMVMVNDGNAKIIRRRETYKDLMLLDVM
jgi:diaminopimelate decarboxylase